MRIFSLRIKTEYKECERHEVIYKNFIKFIFKVFQYSKKSSPIEWSAFFSLLRNDFKIEFSRTPLNWVFRYYYFLLDVFFTSTFFFAFS